MSNAQERVLRDVLNSLRNRGLDGNWGGTDAYLYLRAEVDGYEVLFAPAAADGKVEVSFYERGAFDDGRQPVTYLEALDPWDAACSAWVLGVAYRAGSYEPKPVVRS